MPEPPTKTETDNVEEDLTILGLDYVTQRYIPIFDSYKSILIHIWKSHTED